PGELRAHLTEDRHVDPTEAVDGLLSVAHHEQPMFFEVVRSSDLTLAAPAVASLAREIDDVALYAARVLELIDEQDVERLSDLGRGGPAVEQATTREAEHVAETERAGVALG